MSEYMDKTAVSKLIGANPGYIGYEKGGILTEKVKNKPYCVVLLDEIEKAHSDVFNALLQVLDNGHITDSLGRKINFKNVIIIMTSNVGVKHLQDFGNGIGFNKTVASKNKDKEAILMSEVKKRFSPEFINRLDEIIIFNHLSKADIAKITKLQIKSFEKRLNNLNFTLTISNAAISTIADLGYSEEYGARPLKRAVSKYLETPVTDKILKQHIKKGHITVTVKKKELAYTINEF
jgi:ATP-dependent Clp protease ATP-binding subunit ClpC